MRKTLIISIFHDVVIIKIESSSLIHFLPILAACADCVNGHCDAPNECT
jgi:hypothetical protein